MSVITENQLRRAVRQFLIEKNVLEEDQEMTDELTKIVQTLGVGDQVNKSVLAAAMKAKEPRKPVQNKVIADLFMAILEKETLDPKVISLLKKAAAE